MNTQPDFDYTSIVWDNANVLCLANFMLYNWTLSLPSFTRGDHLCLGPWKQFHGQSSCCSLVYFSFTYWAKNHLSLIIMWSKVKTDKKNWLYLIFCYQFSLHYQRLLISWQCFIFILLHLSLNTIISASSCLIPR